MSIIPYKMSKTDVLFSPEIWNIIKGFAGIKPDFPVEILTLFHAKIKMDELKLCIIRAIHRFLRTLDAGKYTYNFNQAYNKIFDAIDGRCSTTREHRKVIMKTFWRYTHPDVFYYLAADVMKNRRKEKRRISRTDENKTTRYRMNRRLHLEDRIAAETFLQHFQLQYK